MLSAMLRQHGISAVVLGEHLQGALGELPAGALVRLVVDDEHYPAARAVIAQWEAQQPPDVATPRPAHDARARSRVVIAFVLGLLAGAWLTSVWVIGGR